MASSALFQEFQTRCKFYVGVGHALKHMFFFSARKHTPNEASKRICQGHGDVTEDAPWQSTPLVVSLNEIFIPRLR